MSDNLSEIADTAAKVFALDPLSEVDDAPMADRDIMEHLEDKQTKYSKDMEEAALKVMDEYDEILLDEEKKKYR